MSTPTATPVPSIPRKQRKPRARNPTPVSGFSPPATPIAAELAPPATPIAAELAPWERYSNALVVLIRHEPDECERDMLRLKLLAARYTPWR